MLNQRYIKPIALLRKAIQDLEGLIKEYDVKNLTFKNELKKDIYYAIHHLPDACCHNSKEMIEGAVEEIMALISSFIYGISDYEIDIDEMI